MTVALATGQGLGADTHEYLVFRGVTTTIVFSLMAGGIFVADAFLVLRGARGTGVVVAGIVVLAGLIGEVIEAVTGGSAVSLAIGAGIIVAAALPGVLLLLPRGLRSTPPVTADPTPGVTPPPQP
ncbi:hypothetical protein C1632_01690 [Microbacterium testaceum]|uniref:hypothetical protein n=1 Tax=Microbacterium testaceum TaxID=2033 RepID=UPI000CCDB056|nr:hypothetical protein [Microbacterium testaceum]PNW10514.1 hypothetical protein C1632_01690 [Microbacterium testaceum]